jgi:hypothetical protein
MASGVFAGVLAFTTALPSMRVRDPHAPLVSTPVRLLALLRVADPSDLPYDRGRFPHWIESDGCDTRSRVLMAESVTPVVVDDDCTITSGRWTSPYDGATWTTPRRLDIDHLVPLAEAWRSGAWAWTDDERRDYANDLEAPYALVAVTAGVNRAKAERDPAAWLPPDDNAVCRYVTDWVLVKYRWQLAVDAAERSALDDELSGDCGEAPLLVPLTRIAAAMPATRHGDGPGTSDLAG